MPQPLQQHTDQNCATALSQPGLWFSKPTVNPLKSDLKLPPCTSELQLTASKSTEAKSNSAPTASCHCFLAEICQLHPNSVFDCKDLALRSVTVELDVSPRSCRQEAWQLINSEVAAGCTLASINASRLSSGRVLVRPELSAVLPLTLSHVTRLSDIIAGCSVRLCWQCRHRRRGGPLLRCARCRYARYCGPACQAEDWRRHRLECGSAVRTVARLVCFNYAGPEPPFNPFYAFVSDLA
ncbi:hypothetical protein BOX15_Mlig014095g1 [Macrostomum lignano]|uniref:MYND-type domain-containing protein n=1 Tax=Macrostomum lignano TaxID=282301 RepID=A0A267EAU8_9PLAT|nr:hypothetical protein BOX15_Mlig014095g1 [Macrostomum lignano]